MDQVNPEDSFTEAVQAAEAGARLFVRGSHSWQGTLELNKCIQIVGAGAWMTVLTGRWLLSEYGGADEDAQVQTLAAFASTRPALAGFSGVEMRHYAGNGRSVNLLGNYLGETIVVKGGAWRFHACKVCLPVWACLLQLRAVCENE